MRGAQEKTAIIYEIMRYKNGKREQKIFFYLSLFNVLISKEV